MILKSSSADGIVVKYNGVDVTENSEITFSETPAIYDGLTNDYTASFDVSYPDEAASGTFSADVKIALHGDVDFNHTINLYDVIEIAKKIIKGNCSVDGTFNDFAMDVCDVNNVTDIIDIYDAIWCAKLNMELNPPPTPEKPEVLVKPSVSDYDVSTGTGLKAYVNDCIIYRSKYHGMKEENITFVGNEVDEWDGFSWNVPSVYISDMDYYLEQSGGLYPLFYKTTAESLANSVISDIDAAVEEWKMNGSTDEDITLYYGFTIKWEDMGHDNYKVYVMWGGN